MPKKYNKNNQGLKVVYKNVMDLKAYEKNSRTHSSEQIEQIKASINEFGFTNPILIDEGCKIVAGHGRLESAKGLGIKEVPTITLEGLSDTQRRAYVIADNKLALNAGWDESMLRDELSLLDADDFPMELIGFDDDEITDLLANEPEALTDEDQIPEITATPISNPGDIWQLGNHRLMCGDSTSGDDVAQLMDGHKADMVFTDPPYGVDYDGGHHQKGKRLKKLANDGDTNIYSEVLPLLFYYSKEKSALYIWFSDSKSSSGLYEVLYALISSGYEVRNTLIWNKNIAQFGAIGGQYKNKHEPFLYCYKKGSTPYWGGPTNEVSVWDVARSPANEFHPTQKPVEIIERALKNSSKPRSAILDLFGGSGSTIIACEKSSRNCYMMELDPIYCDVIIRRWESYTGQKSLLDGKDFETIEAERLK